MLKFLFVLCVKHEDFIVQTKTNSNQQMTKYRDNCGQANFKCICMIDQILYFAIDDLTEICIYKSLYYYYFNWLAGLLNQCIFMWFIQEPSGKQASRAEFRR